MSIWQTKTTIETINASLTNMCKHLGIVITKIGADYITGTMPVDKKTQQPTGLLHGGASLVLAETLGSIAANLACAKNEHCLGLEINANHLRPVLSGIVTGMANPIHIGKSTQVWSIKIKNEKCQTTCISRITLATKPTRSTQPSF